jgi:hypothetical protein
MANSQMLSTEMVHPFGYFPEPEYLFIILSHHVLRVHVVYVILFVCLALISRILMSSTITVCSITDVNVIFVYV